MGEGGLEEKEGMVRIGEGDMMDMYAEGGVRFWGKCSSDLYTSFLIS